jgi:hypothetical protein
MDRRLGWRDGRWRSSTTLQRDRPFVVSLHATGTDDTGTETTLVCASPEQAREMAAALLVYAHTSPRSRTRWPIPLAHSRRTPLTEGP